MEVMMIFVGSSGVESWGGVGSRGHPPPRTRHRLPWWNRRVVVAQEGRRAGSGGVGRLAQAEINESAGWLSGW